MTSVGSGGTTGVEGLRNDRWHTRRKHMKVLNNATRSKPLILLNFIHLLHSISSVTLCLNYSLKITELSSLMLVST